MDKYTVVYGHFFQIGSHRSSITNYEHIECEPHELNDVVGGKFGWDDV